jgi:hypothetical protein
MPNTYGVGKACGFDTRISRLIRLEPSMEWCEKYGHLHQVINRRRHEVARNNTGHTIVSAERCEISDL